MPKPYLPAGPKYDRHVPLCYLRRSTFGRSEFPTWQIPSGRTLPNPSGSDLLAAATQHFYVWTVLPVAIELFGSVEAAAEEFQCTFDHLHKVFDGRRGARLNDIGMWIAVLGDRKALPTRDTLIDRAQNAVRQTATRKTGWSQGVPRMHLVTSPAAAHPGRIVDDAMADTNRMSDYANKVVDAIDLIQVAGVQAAIDECPGMHDPLEPLEVELLLRDELDAGGWNTKEGTFVAFDVPANWLKRAGQAATQTGEPPGLVGGHLVLRFDKMNGPRPEKVHALRGIPEVVDANWNPTNWCFRSCSATVTWDGDVPSFDWDRSLIGEASYLEGQHLHWLERPGHIVEGGQFSYT